MAMELSVLSDRTLTSFTEWQRAIDAEGFPLRLTPNTELARVNGFLPAELSGQATGFECYHDDTNEFFESFVDLQFDHRWGRVLGFRWIGDFSELQAAWMAATAYARATQGMVFDPQEEKTYTPPAAREAVREIERELPAIKAAIREAEVRIAVKFKKSPRGDV